MTTTVLFAALPAGATPHARSAVSWHGTAAVGHLGSKLANVAARHHLSADTLKRLFATDRTLGVGPGDALYYAEPAVDPSLTPPAPEATVTEDSDAVDEFQLHSRPGSNRVLYLDFDGFTIKGDTAWGSYLNNTDCYADPFNIDGNANSFSSSERVIVRTVWKRVAEDFAPFDLDVTTEDPGDAAIERVGIADNRYGARALITQSTNVCSNGKNLAQAVCAYSCGGIAYVGVFNHKTSHRYLQPALVFPPLLSNNGKYIAEATSHEIGHNLGLLHDGSTDGCGIGGVTACVYSYGHDHWAPIMGVGYTRPIVQWSKGEYHHADQTQDDLAVMQTYGLSLVPDDHGDTAETATHVAAPGFVEDGLIRSRTDVDVFAIDVGDGEAAFAAEPSATSPNLDVRLELRDSNFDLIEDDDPESAFGTADVATGMSAAITTTLTAGRYYLVVDGAGLGDPADAGYSDYGSLGRYELTGTTAEPPPPDPVPPGAPTELAATVRNGHVQLAWNAPEDEGTEPVSGYAVTVTAPGGGEAEGVDGETTRAAAGLTTEFDFTGLTNETEYEFTVAAVSDAGFGEASAPVDATPDGTAPVATVTPLGRWTLATGVITEWSADDEGSGVDGFDVEMQSASYSGSFGAWVPWFATTKLAASWLTPAYGTTTCVRVRATDRAGNVGDDSDATCTAVPLHTGQLAFSSGWGTTNTGSAFGGKYRGTVKAGASVTRSGIKAESVALVATKCKTCGAVKVYWNGVYKKTVSLTASTTSRKQVVSLLNFGSVTAGTLKLVTANAKPVYIEGLGVSKT